MYFFIFWQVENQTRLFLYHFVVTEMALWLEHQIYENLTEL